MENKEVIMVDDVDVSGCKFKGFKNCRLYTTDRYESFLKCDNLKNCYYKQLKRTEKQLEAKDKEIEELKGKLQVATEALNRMNNQVLDTGLGLVKCCNILRQLAQQVLKQIER